MNFSPRMESRIRGIEVAGELKWRVWDGVVADVWEVACGPGAEGYYISPDPRLFVILDLDPGGAFVLGKDRQDVMGRHEAAGSISFVPAGMPLYGRSQDLTFIRHLDLHFSEAAITRRFGKAIDRERLLAPQLGFIDPKIEMLARAIAEECTAPTARHDLFGESLVNALLALLFDVPRDVVRRNPGLSRKQLAIVVNFIERHCFDSIRIAELAELAGLSETYFSHAFKASTGLPPHRWQMQARVSQVQDMIRGGEMSLSEAAMIAGFADQAHLSRVFKKFVGLTPAEWRRGATGARDNSATTGDDCAHAPRTDNRAQNASIPDTVR